MPSSEQVEHEDERWRPHIPLVKSDLLNAYRIARWSKERRWLRRHGLRVPAFMLPIPTEVPADAQ
jgi:hypothetical protein